MLPWYGYSADLHQAEFRCRVFEQDPDILAGSSYSPPQIWIFWPGPFVLNSSTYFGRKRVFWQDLQLFWPNMFIFAGSGYFDCNQLFWSFPVILAEFIPIKKLYLQKKIGSDVEFLNCRIRIWYIKIRAGSVWLRSPCLAVPRWSREPCGNGCSSTGSGQPSVKWTLLGVKWHG